MSPDEIAHRVAARFAAEPVDNDTAIDAPNEELLSTDQLREELERRLGALEVITVHDPQDGTGVSRWEAISGEGSTIRGTVSVGSMWLDDRLVMWPEVETAGAVGPVRAKAAGTPRQLLDDRLRQVGVRLRRLLTEVRARPDKPAHELAADLQEVVDLAEQD